MSFDPAVCYRRAERYLPAIDTVCRQRGEEPSILAALGSRETEFGWAGGYHPQGLPDGTGDWCARTGSWLTRSGVQVVQRIPLRWAAPRNKDGTIRPGPYAIPGDGLGWGRGLWQLDFCGDFRHLYRPEPWAVELQVEAACEMLALARQQLAAFQSHPLYERACLARYNAALARIVGALQASLDPDSVTTAGPSGRPDYGSDIQARAAALRAAYPFVFAPPLPPAAVPTPVPVGPGEGS